MLITKEIKELCVFENETIFNALKKVNDNKSRIVFVVNDSMRLLGSFSDGDFRRWITKSDNISLEQPVSKVYNPITVHKNIKSHRADIEKLFKPSINIIPLVNEHHQVIAVATKEKSAFRIGKHIISDETPSYIIAEIGNNHQGDIHLAKQLVDLANEAGADCIKFQMRNMESLYRKGNESDASADLGTQYTMDLLAKFQLSNEELIEIFEYVKSLGKTPLCTPWDLKSLELLENYGMEAYKVASADFTNFELLEALAKTGKPLICSTGMSTEQEIKRTSEFLHSKNAQFVILHCNSTYPTPFKDVNLAYLPRLKEITQTIIGYSGHERGISVPTVAVGLGCKVVEKHFTIDKSLEGNDHKVSLLPEEFKEMVESIREVEEAMGTNSERVISQGEMLNREILAKSLISKVDIVEGQIITKDMVEVKSPGQGLQPIYLENLVGKEAKRTITAGTFFYDSDISDEIIRAKDYKFARPFGIPVRYHDFKKLNGKSNLDFVEFHLSYQDMDLSIEKFIDKDQKGGFAVHSPELFKNDHILDLASKDQDYRMKSIAELNRVCEITRELKSFFPKTEKPEIVVNVGGFNTKGFIPTAARKELYDLVADSLSKVNSSGVEIIIQTMPPFPWHFGGQSYHNLFMDHNEIANFCSEYGYRICYDVSHSMMSCNYFNWQLTDFTKTVGPYIAHMHIVDALGIDGEGVEIGKGDVDFEELAKDLKAVSPNSQFIPEVWQGHKNEGEGFWKALEFLETYL